MIRNRVEQRALTVARWRARALVWAVLVLIASTWPGVTAQLGPAIAAAVEPEGCTGDERMNFLPAEPYLGEEFLVVVSSSRRHRGVYLTGSEKAREIDGHEIVGGWAHRWLVLPTFKGLQHYSFFVDSSTFCAEGSVNVLPSRRPDRRDNTRNADADNDNNGNDSNGNDSNGNDNNGNDNDQPRSPNINSISPADSCAGGKLTLKGRHFGEDRSAVHGQVVVSGLQASIYLSWRSDEVVILVPNGAPTGLAQDVYISHDGGYDHATVNLSSSPC